MLSDKQILSYQNRAKALAYRILRNEQDAEDISTLAVMDYLESVKRNPEITPRLKWLVINCIRREFGDTRYARGKFNYAERNQFKRIDAELNEDDPSSISEEHLCAAEHAEERSDPIINEDIARRLVPDDYGDESARSEANRLGVSESRISQKRADLEKKLVRDYLWEHYKEHGIESELEIEWL